MKNLICMAVALVAALAWGVPSVTVDSVTPEVGAPVAVTVAYTLSGKAVVTAEMFAGEAALKGEFDGDVNVLLEAGSHIFRWRADVSVGGAYAAGALTAKVKAWDPESPPDYMAVDLANASAPVRYYATSNDVPGGVTSRKYTINWMLFRRIPAKNVEWYYGSSGPVTPGMQAGTKHYVKFTEDYYAGIYEVTQAQWSNVYVNAGISGITAVADPSNLKTGDDLPIRPVEHISIAEVRGMVADGIDWPTTGHQVRAAPKSFLGCLRNYCGVEVDLPTEAQWEYACRAGTGTKYCCGDTWDDSYGWTSANCTAPQPVGTTIPNAWGLYDFHGNVYESCLDWMDTVNYDYPDDDNTDPKGPATGSNRCLRGGTWNGAPNLTASYLRGWVSPGNPQANQGLRLFCPAEVK